MIDICKGKGFYGRNLEQDEPGYMTKVNVLRRNLIKSFNVEDNMGKVYEVVFEDDDGSAKKVYTGELYGFSGLWEIDVWNNSDIAEKYLRTYPWRTDHETEEEIENLFMSIRQGGYVDQGGSIWSSCLRSER